MYQLSIDEGIKVRTEFMKTTIVIFHEKVTSFDIKVVFWPFKVEKEPNIE